MGICKLLHKFNIICNFHTPNLYCNMSSVIHKSNIDADASVKKPKDITMEIKVESTVLCIFFC